MIYTDPGRHKKAKAEGGKQKAERSIFNFPFGNFQFSLPFALCSFWLPPSAFRLLLSAFCLPPSAFCFLSSDTVPMLLLVFGSAALIFSGAAPQI
jgi:hypothetical protein